jgi:hypothetical protein
MIFQSITVHIDNNSLLRKFLSPSDIMISSTIHYSCICGHAGDCQSIRVQYYDCEQIIAFDKESKWLFSWFIYLQSCAFQCYLK